jgi:hypothetical protein
MVKVKNYFLEVQPELMHKVTKLKLKKNMKTNFIQKLEEKMKFDINSDNKKLQHLCFLGNEKQKVIIE